MLFDCKAEYNLTDNLQLILSAKNILNQKSYNLTIEDTDMFSKSFSSYDIRPRNVLLSLYYKFWLSIKKGYIFVAFFINNVKMLFGQS